MKVNLTYSTACTANGSTITGYLSSATADTYTLQLELIPVDGETVEEPIVGETTITGSGSFTFPGIQNGVYFLRVLEGTELVTAQGMTLECNYVPVTQPPISNPCVAVKEFTISPSRYVRFFMTFKQRTTQKECRVEWLEKGYTGLPEEVRGASNPVHITRQGVGNKIDVIKGSGMSIDLLVEDYDTLKNFYTADERKYRVDYYEDGVLLWQGYHLADIYNEPWISAPFHASIQAADGLGSLSNMAYVDSTGQRYYGRERSLIVLFRCLRKLDLELPVWCAINLWENTMNLDVEPLWQSYVDQGGYYNDENEPISCQEVIERILQPYNAFVTQSDAALHIIRYSETKGAYLRRKALIGTSDATVLIDVEKEDFEEVYTILPADRGGLVSYREKSQAVISRPALKFVSVITAFGKYENFLFNGDFERWGTDKPLFWEGEAEVAKIANGNKFSLAFTNPLTGGGIVDYLRNQSYQYPVKSEVGFTLSLDYHVIIDDFPVKENYSWIEYPFFKLEGANLYLDNDPLFLAKANFNGAEVTFQNGLIKSDIAPVPDQSLQKRIDLLYASASGTWTYVEGTVNWNNSGDLVVDEPANALAGTYITWENGEAKFGSVSSFLKVDILTGVRIGDYTATRNTLARRRQSRYSADMDADDKTNIAVWGQQVPAFGFSITGIESNSGYASKKGTFTVHMNPLSVAGLPELSISTPNIDRNNARGVQIIIDNVSFTERKGVLESIAIVGKNDGQINTPPFELNLKHGSHLPRTQALLTLADGSPAMLWDNGDMLQEITARDILFQHARPTLVLTAVLAGYFSPNAILKDEYIAGARFLVDNYVYSPRELHTVIEAQEVFGGVEDEQITDKTRVLEDGTPRVLENYTYRVIE